MRRPNDPFWPLGLGQVTRFDDRHNEFQRSFDRTRAIVTVGVVAVFALAIGTFVWNALLDNGVGSQRLQARAEQDAERYGLDQHPQALSVRARCVVRGGADLPCTVTGVSDGSAFSESILCRASLATGARGCYRLPDRSVTLDRTR
jgi:hypothetical protein